MLHIHMCKYPYKSYNIPLCNFPDMNLSKSMNSLYILIYKSQSNHLRNHLCILGSNLFCSHCRKILYTHYNSPHYNQTHNHLCSHFYMSFCSHLCKLMYKNFCIRSKTVLMN